MSETCDWCDKSLYGNLVVSSGVLNGLGYVRISEQTPRNWIVCDGCNVMICHACAPDYKTGYCPDCIRDDELDEAYEEAVRRDS